MKKNRIFHKYLGNDTDMATVSVECQWELVCDLSNGAIFSDLE